MREALALHVVGTPQEAKADPKLFAAIKAVRDEAKRLGVRFVHRTRNGRRKE